MNHAPTNHDGSSDSPTAIESCLEALAAEFPGLSSEHLAAAYENVRRRSNTPLSDDILKTRLRLLCQSRGMSHTL
ncbi:hypothetical protein SAMN02745166_04180 [Prosthecobacter debontii]|uniref:Uncharacterized protein n=1 Tax=Prosthecobacter debontii TaxID=48467 RepID=A0A1T4YU52_9BACT|nr:hypothetical protein [Prosthecobacter debontii]SKB05128.1 hypothetical protein SAMN02745166_04180 [Prosthecobacter debontii]